MPDVEEYWGDFAEVQWAPGEYDAYLRSCAEWRKRKKIVAQLSNGQIVWFTTVYEQTAFDEIAKVLEVVDEAEYIMRKLANTLDTEYVASDWNDKRN